jgi:hypothetical protein
MKAYFWDRPRAWVVIVLGLGMALANFQSAAGQVFALDHVVAPAYGCSGSYDDDHAKECLPACGTYCQAVLPDEVEAVGSRSRSFLGVVEHGVGGRIGHPEPGPPKSSPVSA